MRRNFLNITMLLLFILTVSFHFLPKILHEVLGILWFVAVFCHLYLNRKWIFSLNGGKWTINRSISVFINFMLIIAMVAVMVTGVFISNYIFKGLVGMELARNITAHQLHVSLPYLIIILSGVHLGLHIKGLWLRLLNFLTIDKNSAKARVAAYAFSITLVILGIYGSFLDRVGDRLLMKHIFATQATNLPFAAFLSILLGIFGLYVVFGYGIDRVFTKHKA